jgi:hypothetical protein
MYKILPYELKLIPYNYEFTMNFSQRLVRHLWARLPTGQCINLYPSELDYSTYVQLEARSRIETSVFFCLNLYKSDDCRLHW